jgi:hypothetical protein
MEAARSVKTSWKTSGSFSLAFPIPGGACNAINTAINFVNVTTFPPIFPCRQSFYQTQRLGFYYRYHCATTNAIVMAPRRGAEVQQEEQLGGLKFNQTLSWRAGKAIPTVELIKRLETLATELRELDQELTDKDSLGKVAKELAGQNLLSHKDKGVRAFAACCLVDVLKLCAPDAPFTGTQLRVWPLY